MRFRVLLPFAAILAAPPLRAREKADRSMSSLQNVLCLVMCLMLISATMPEGAWPQEGFAPFSAADLDSLVAPIALYPDELVAQVLGAATYPDQIAEAYDWLQSNSGLQGQALMSAIDEQNWDDAVKAVCMFPSVLSMMSDNLSWTSALGEAAAMQQADVMAAVQRMRSRAFQAGNLNTTREIKVVQQSPDVIVIQPANPQVVYVPTFNPTVIYGAPVVVPGWYSPVGLAATPIISFGPGIAIGPMINNRWGWGWNGWGMHWGRGNIYFRNRVYIGNPYWRGRPPGYFRGYRPPFFPPPPRRAGFRPPGVRPPTLPPPSTRPPRPVRPVPPIAPIPPPAGGRPPGGGGGGRPSGGAGGGGRPPGGRPTTQPAPGPGTTRPARQPRPSPAEPMPGQRDLRGYGTGTRGSRAGAFSPSPSDRSASIRGNQSLGNTRSAPRPAPAERPTSAPRRTRSGS